MRRSVQFIGAATLALAFSSSPYAQEAPLWVGTFVNEEQSDQGIQSGIETAVKKMNFITRSVARGRLKKTNPAYRRITISRTDETISVALDDRKPIEMPADGSPVKWTREDGEVFDVTAQAEEGRLVQTFMAEDGERVNTFSANDADQMTMEVQVRSPQLTAPLIYTLLYRRAPDE
jgi:hypothetical protein